MEEKRILSIITPTYNRAKLLHRCYDSLVIQSCKEFEWIIVDDGSSDNTEEVIKGFSGADNSFPIIYIKKKNGGKHTALNEAHKYISGDYVLTLDSDDILTDNAVEIVLKEWVKWENNKQVGIVTFLKGTDSNHPCAYVPEERTPVDIIKCKRICVSTCDCCEVIRTDLFKQFPFPVFEEEKFMGETVLWYRVSYTHKCVYINEVIYICEYLEDGLTKSGRILRINSPRGGMINSELVMDKRNDLLQRVKNGLLYVCYGFFAGMKPLDIVRNSKKYRLLKVVCLVPGYFLFLRWKKQYS
ncbi:MAG: glycosyltransferase family 2 protein [Lachnospiraceae bacterium]|nr:glycosyltransferase family 2 protein [Lachnospiraceae bacterium]